MILLTKEDSWDSELPKYLRQRSLFYLNSYLLQAPELRINEGQWTGIEIANGVKLQFVAAYFLLSSAIINFKELI
jgi:hypothetical protein